LQWAHKNVFDFGTGTGILAILAEKLGAAQVTAIDNDTWSIENATENIIANQCSHVQLALSDQLPEQGKYDFVLANINTFIIKQYLPSLTKMLAPEGQLLLSGLLVEDITALISSCDVLGLRVLSAETLGDWGLLRLAY
jgi:ribosomal protein L11 methyltransferase